MLRTRTAVAIAALLTVPTVMSGCLVTSGKEQEIHGAYVQPGAASKVEVNQTTKSEVEEILGQPSMTKVHDDGTETWTWSWTEHKEEGGAVFLIFAGGSEKTVHESLHIKFRDDVAIKKWRD